MKKLVLTWPANGLSGWGWYGANLCRHASLEGWAVSAPRLDRASLPPEWALEGWDIRPLPDDADVVLVACGNGPIPARKTTVRTRMFAVIFFEDTHIDAERVQALNAYDGVICGSQWNAQLLKAAGVERIHVVLQGADAYTYHVKREGIDARPRRIFSGGKLEFRKGQDIVVAAFREYLKQDPDAVLVTAWQNPVAGREPRIFEGLDAMAYIEGVPAPATDGTLGIVGWAESNGIPRRNVVDVGLVPSHTLQRLMAGCDVAVFPNRAEGGHNLIAAEAMACGVPTFVTYATGQCDLPFSRECALSFTPSPSSARCSLYRERDGWAEADLPPLIRAMGGDAMGVSPPPTWGASIGLLLGIVVAEVPR